MNHAISGEILVQEVRFPRSEIFLATLGAALPQENHEGVICCYIEVGPLSKLRQHEKKGPKSPKLVEISGFKNLVKWRSCLGLTKK